MRFDAFGARRRATDFASFSARSIADFDVSTTTRGFTGHETLDPVGLIHMNGRVYDPHIGRFLSADPIVQAPVNTQSLNRYAYGFNNPLSGTDPSGYVFGVDDILIGVAVGAIVGRAGQALDIPVLSAIGSLVTCGASGIGCVTGFAFGSTLGAGGSLGDALKNGAFAGVTAYAFSGIGEAFSRTPLEGGWQHIGSHALAGGILAELQGGRFGHGFLSAGLTKALNVNRLIPGAGDGRSLGRILTAAVAGGTISQITGGKFANGAVTAAFAQAYNGERQIAKAEAVQQSRFLNTRSDCPSDCTLIHNPDGTKMFVPSGVAGDVVAANAKGISLSAEQTTSNPSVSDVVRGVGTAADATMLIFPASSPVTGPVGRGADILQAIIDGSPWPFIPGTAARGVQNTVLKRGGSVNSAIRAGAGTELVVDQMVP